MLVETARSSPSVGDPDLGTRHDLGDRTEKKLGHQRVAQPLDGLLLFGREVHLPEDAGNLAAPNLLGRDSAEQIQSACSWRHRHFSSQGLRRASDDNHIEVCRSHYEDRLLAKHPPEPAFEQRTLRHGCHAFRKAARSDPVMPRSSHSFSLPIPHLNHESGVVLSRNWSINVNQVRSLGPQALSKVQFSYLSRTSHWTPPYPYRGSGLSGRACRPRGQSLSRRPQSDGKPLATSISLYPPYPQINMPQRLRVINLSRYHLNIER